MSSLPSTKIIIKWHSISGAGTRIQSRVKIVPWRLALKSQHPFMRSIHTSSLPPLRVPILATPKTKLPSSCGGEPGVYLADRYSRDLLFGRNVRATVPSGGHSTQIQLAVSSMILVPTSPITLNSLWLQGSFKASGVPGILT